MQHPARPAAVEQTKVLSFCLWLCHTPNKSSVDAVGTKGRDSGKQHLALCLHCVFHVEGLLQDHTLHRFTNTRLALPHHPALSTRGETCFALQDGQPSASPQASVTLGV